MSRPRGGGAVQLADVPRVMRAARDRAGLSQSGLARAAGVSPASVVRWEQGVRSPTVRQLDALMAACGLQAEVALIARAPALAGRIDAVLQARPMIDTAQLAVIARALDKAELTWAVDGCTALAMQGMAMGEDLSFVLVDDDAFRRWLYRSPVQARDRFNDMVPLSMGETSENIDAAFARDLVLGWGLGFLRLRRVDALPETVLRLGLDDELDVPVLPVLDVVRAFPDWADVVHGVLGRLGAQS